MEKLKQIYESLTSIDRRALKAAIMYRLRISEKTFYRYLGAEPRTDGTERTFSEEEWVLVCRILNRRLEPLIRYEASYFMEQEKATL